MRGRHLADDDLVCHLEPARPAGVQRLRAHPAHGPQPELLLAAGAEQALRGTAQARHRRTGESTARTRTRRPQPRRLPDHARRPAGPRPLARRTRCRADPRVRGAAEDRVRRPRLDRRAPGQPRHDQAGGRRRRAPSASSSPRSSSTEPPRSATACTSACSSGASSTTGLPSARHGPRRRWRGSRAGTTSPPPPRSSPPPRRGSRPTLADRAVGGMS